VNQALRREWVDVAVKVTALLTPVVLTSLGWIGAALIDHESRLDVIESNRFTHQNGTDMKKEIMQELPPEWLREDIREIKGMLRTMESRLNALERKVGQ
jgi:hypothetical protein